MFMMVSKLVAGVCGLFVTGNSEELKVFNEQMDRGYEWNYVGAQLPPENTTFISLSRFNGEKFILFQLKKPKSSEDMAELIE